MSVNGTLVEDTMRRFKGECAHFSFNKCPICTDDGTSAKFSTNSHETDYSEVRENSTRFYFERSAENYKTYLEHQEEFVEVVVVVPASS